MLNVLDIQDQLKNFSEQQLVKEMQMPSGNAPQFLVLSEINRRKRMKDAQKANEAAQMKTVAQDLVTAAGVPQQGIMQMAQAMNPKSSNAQNAGLDAILQKQQQQQPQQGAPVPQMYGGGYVKRMQAGGRVVVNGRQYEEFGSGFLRDPETGQIFPREQIESGQREQAEALGRQVQERFMGLDAFGGTGENQMPSVRPPSPPAGVPSLPAPMGSPTDEMRRQADILAQGQEQRRMGLDPFEGSQGARGPSPISVDFDATLEENGRDTSEYDLRGQIAQAARSVAPKPPIDSRGYFDIDETAVTVPPVGLPQGDDPLSALQRIQRQMEQKDIASGATSMMDTDARQAALSPPPTESVVAEPIMEGIKAVGDVLSRGVMPSRIDPSQVDPSFTEKKPSVRDDYFGPGVSPVDDYFGPGGTGLPEAVTGPVFDDAIGMSTEALKKVSDKPRSVEDSGGSVAPQAGQVADSVTSAGLALQEAGKQRTDIDAPVSEVESEILEMLKSKDKRANQDMWLALAQAGAKYASGANIGDAISTGLKSYGDARAAYQKDKLSLLLAQEKLRSAKEERDYRQRSLDLRQRQEGRLAKSGETSETTAQLSQINEIIKQLRSKLGTYQAKKVIPEVDPVTGFPVPGGGRTETKELRSDLSPDQRKVAMEILAEIQEYENRARNLVGNLGIKSI